MNTNFFRNKRHNIFVGIWSCKVRRNMSVRSAITCKYIICTIDINGMLLTFKSNTNLNPLFSLNRINSNRIKITYFNVSLTGSGC